MKLYLLPALPFIIGCGTSSDTPSSDNIQGDTVTTASGLQYYFFKRGTGRQIEDGCLVGAYNKLYLNTMDTVFWSTDSSEDSVFTFVQGRTSLIKGALELYPLLREGDELLAIMPDSIAYGKEDRNGLPGGSTLIFNPIKIKYVSAPKNSLSDTLITVIQSGTVDDMMNVHKGIATSALRETYHMQMDLLGDILRYLINEERFQDAEEVANRLEAVSKSGENIDGLWYYKVQAVVLQGDTTRAIAVLEEIIAKAPDNTFWQTMIGSLKN